MFACNKQLTGVTITVDRTSHPGRRFSGRPTGQLNYDNPLPMPKALPHHRSGQRQLGRGATGITVTSRCQVLDEIWAYPGEVPD